MYEEKNNTATESESIDFESLPERVREILKNKWIYANREGFIVSAPDAGGNPVDYCVTRDFRKALICSCETYQRESQKDRHFLCEHLQAVDFYLLAKLKALSNPPDIQVPIKWRCHFRTQQSIENLMKQISAHPEGKSIAELREMLKRRSGDRDAPEGSLQEGAERIERWLREWLTNLTAADEMDRAA
jgi:hypothetical protein